MRGLEVAPAGGRITGMTMVKKTVTLDADLVGKAARAAAASNGGSFSAYVNEAIAQRLRREGLDALVELDIKLRGPINDADVEATLESIRAVWDD